MKACQILKASLRANLRGAKLGSTDRSTPAIKRWRRRVDSAPGNASKVIGLLAKDKLVGNPCIAHSDEMMCNGCSTCERVCPYGAITYIDKEFRMPDRTTKVRRVASVNEAVCQGCGAIQHLDDDRLAHAMRARAGETGFRPTRAVLELLGWCTSCEPETHKDRALP